MATTSPAIYPTGVILDPVLTLTLTPRDPVDDDAALDIKCDSTSLEVYRCASQLNDTYVAHEYMAPSELSKLTLDELKARRNRL
jgi:hypothetical protein